MSRRAESVWSSAPASKLAACATAAAAATDSRPGMWRLKKLAHSDRLVVSQCYTHTLNSSTAANSTGPRGFPPCASAAAHSRAGCPATAPQPPPEPPALRCPSTAAPAQQPQHGGMHRHVKGGACMEPRQLRQAVGAGAAAEAALGVTRGQADDALGVGGGVPGGLPDGLR